MKINQEIEKIISDKKWRMSVENKEIERIESYTKGKAKYYLEELIALGIKPENKMEVKVDYEILIANAKSVISKWNISADKGDWCNGNKMQRVDEQEWINRTKEKWKNISTIELGQYMVKRRINLEAGHSGRCLDHLYSGYKEPFLYLPFECLYIEENNNNDEVSQN